MSRTATLSAKLARAGFKATVERDPETFNTVVTITDRHGRTAAHGVLLDGDIDYEIALEYDDIDDPKTWPLAEALRAAMRSIEKQIARRR